MIAINEKKCPKCGGDLKQYDKVIRIVRTKRRVTNNVEVRRLKCLRCGSIHRELPNYIYPYKQYEFEVIRGVLEGIITPETLGFEDFPCESTMNRWKTQNLHILL